MGNKEEISWDQYKVFMEVYEAGSYSEPARNSGVTRFAIMYHIRELSKKLGVTLFVNNTHGVDPTTAAKDLYPLIKKASEMFIAGEEVVKDFNEESEGTVRVRCSSHLAEKILDCSDSFRKMYPKIKFEILTDYGDLELLRDKKVDLLFSHRTTLSPEFETVEIGEFTRVFCATEKFLERHGIGDTVTLAQLKCLPTIGTKIVLSGHALDKFGFNTSINVASFEATLIEVMKHRGIGFFHSEYLDKLQDKSIVRLKLADVELPIAKLTCTYCKHLSTKVTKAFLNYLLNYLKQFPFLE